MATQGAVSLVDHEWRLLGSGPNVAIATQKRAGGFYAIISAAKPAVDINRAAAFYGHAGKPVTYAGLQAIDQVWGISLTGDIDVSVAKS